MINNSPKKLSSKQSKSRNIKRKAKDNYNWRIERVELIYYEPLHSQWQSFQHNPGYEPSQTNPHRVYIQELLKSFVEHLKDSTNETNIILNKTTPSDKKKISLSFSEGALNQIAEFSSHEPELWEGLVNILINRVY